MIGKKFGKLTVIEKIKYYNKNNKISVRWKCKCDCGNEIILNGYDILSGRIKSCGHHKGPIKHGLTNTKLYRHWQTIIGRCYYPSTYSYKNYGNKGIIVCEEWLGENGFINFYNWSINNGWSEGKDLSIDRIDPKGNYCPENCRWIPRKYQSNNRSNNVLVDFNGEKYTVPQIANILGISKYKLRYDLKNNNWNFNSLLKYIPDEYGVLRPHLLDIHGQIIPLNSIYFIDEYGFPVNMNEYK